MIDYIITAGATSRRIGVWLADSSSTTGAGLTGLTNASAGLTAYYWRESDGNVAGTAITLAAGTLGTYSSGGFVAKDGTNLPGLYELGVPDAALATGAKWVKIMLKGATNLAPRVVTIKLEALDLDTALSSQTVSAVSGAVGSVTGAVGSVTGAVGSVTGAVGSVTGNVGGNVVGSVGSVTAAVSVTGDLSATMKTSVEGAVWNATRAGHVTAGTFGEGLASVQGNVTGSVGSVTGAVGSVTAAVTVGTNNDKTGYALTAGEHTTITGDVWNGTRASFTTAGSFGQGVASVQGNVTGSVGSVTGAVGSVTGAVGSVTGNVGGNVVGSVASVAAGGITTASFGAGAIDSTVLAQTAADRVWSTTTRNLTGSQGIKKNTALAAFPFLMTDSTNHAPKTALTVTASRSLDGAAYAACANAVVEVGNGMYKIDLAATDLNGNTVALRFTATGADDRDITIVTSS